MSEVGLDTHFSLDRLRNLLVAATQSDSFIRHDIDFDVEAAYKMAEFEHELGVRANYYVRLLGPYNPFGKRNRDWLTRISLTLGHRLGVHVDLERGREANVPLDSILKAHERQREMLTTGLGDILEPGLLSVHAPPASVLWLDDPALTTVEYAYAGRWEHHYVSDGRGIFRDSPEVMLRDHAPIQIALHPEWWWLPSKQADDLRRQELFAP